jgi:hypothetical protein
MWVSDRLSLNLPLPYEVGSILEYEPFGGGVRRVRVTAKEADVKHGEPGFDGVLVAGSGFDTADEDGEEWEGTGVWGYDSQILRVLSA